jgi:hypothetical protein
MPRFRLCCFCCVLLAVALAATAAPAQDSATAAPAQDSATGAIRGVVFDVAGRVGAATVALVNTATNFPYTTTSDSTGRFAFEMLPPGDYSARAESPGMSPQAAPGLHVYVGGTTYLEFRLAVAGATETVTVSGESPLVEAQPAAVSTLIDEKAITELPLNGRRYTDLALLAPGVTQDPRGLTSGSNGDLAFGGIRGFQSSYLVMAATTITRSSDRPAAATAHPISFPMKWCGSSAFPPTPTALIWDGPAAPWST